MRPHSLARRRPSLANIVSRPLRQGDLDSLCGVYSIINATRFLCPEIDREVATDLFDMLLETLAKRKAGAHEAVTVGLDLRAVSQMLRTACSVLSETLDIRLRASPLAPPNKRPTLDQVWASLQEMIGDESIAIIGLSGLREHWTVGHRVTARQIMLMDSDAMRVLSRAHCDVRRNAAPYRLRAQEIIILRRVQGD